MPALQHGSSLSPTSFVGLKGEFEDRPLASDVPHRVKSCPPKAEFLAFEEANVYRTKEKNE